MSSSTYFSIDYRSPPSGMGQIVKNSTIINVEHDFKGDWYTLSEFSRLFDYLTSQGVETVYDVELSYEYPEYFDENHNIPLVDWIMIIKQTAC